MHRKKYCQEHKKEFRERHLKYYYGFSLEEYQGMLIAQKGMCAICGKPETKSGKFGGDAPALSIDHDHETGKVRGLLCARCNVGLGMFREDKKYLKKAIDYLEGGER